ncbi:hypothetical protein F9C07_1181682 [Aspergillus flavus]|uniref:C6 transcription factor n=6 Tax=Aspergillus subgen. Circumdati TaxID=2720871 RepID=A0A7U2QSN4_ASPFN|nr:unnamed protein product [Aspergillus oryzae RIB40]XP_041142071.1 uncharacterized protein G4B84_002357 [Aspergillus flavus NRRL3357]EIT76299.1 hypothetical protein Ao3042_07556 [Aspergillus oryzae 3.042]KAB8244951.1 hypothetical protein BDV35DRAFT_272110 [Aspergillus flavus]KDE83385.1 hypothetical protein AO1008_10005 [Aspergillus oryzae 100-8]OOO04934.1 Protein of unknown function DUF3468 [Aspergillus oryzae]GMG48220.1 unnamed protein product [Aspergillus oryzae var. brunneus]|eukprot:EIT76299.1 hypothetical protein Ao3042_07556 [Aspergillus oryzae 3.042]
MDPLVSSHQATGEGIILSPGTHSLSESSYAAHPRFLELQEELRSALFTAVADSTPKQSYLVEAPTEPGLSELRHDVDLFARSPVPKARLISYLKNWITECAPYLDKFDEARHFGVHIPILARESPGLFYAILAFSARQTERKAGLRNCHDSLELYQESIRWVSPGLQAKDPNVLVTACVLAVMELMSVSPQDWRRHVDGCAALFDCFNVNGFSGGHLQAVFWCYVRMELCGVIVSNGAERTVLPLDKWVPAGSMGGASESIEDNEKRVRELFLDQSRLTPDMHANWAVYLCAKACDLVCRRTRHLELGEFDTTDPRPFQEQWKRLWDELQFWLEQRPSAILPAKSTSMQGDRMFPEIFYAHQAAISSNQLYHTSCILLLEIKPPAILLPSSSHLTSSVWHARRVCGISLTNPHPGNLINAIQPLYIAGKLLTHRREHIAVAKLFRTIEQTTGWGALWRLRDLEAVWGYETNEILSVI